MLCGGSAVQSIQGQLIIPGKVTAPSQIQKIVETKGVSTERNAHQEVLQGGDALATLLQDCAWRKDLHEGSKLHGDLLKQGLFLKDVRLGNMLLNMYAKCGALSKAQDVFDELPVQDVVSWNILITGYAQHRHGDKALKCFGKMQNEGIPPDAITFTSVLKACGSIRAAQMGEDVHAKIDRSGLLKKDTVLGSALVDMYAKCGQLAKAQEVFNQLSIGNAISWNVLITGYVQHGHNDKVLECFVQMKGRGLSPDAITFVGILKACGSTHSTWKGQEVHADIVKQGLLERNTILGTALLDMYAKCGALARAQQVFNELHMRDVVCWNAMISGYVYYGCEDEAMSCFEWMQDEGFTPDTITLCCILKACGSLGAVEKGVDIHVELGRQGLLLKKLELGTALVDMYAKCGLFAEAQGVFDELSVQDLVSRSVLIAGYAQVGDMETVLRTLSKMIGVQHTEPDLVTFAVLLSACSHAGLVNDAQFYFEVMGNSYNIIPNIEHYTCIVDLFSRAGLFSQAISVAEKVPHADCLQHWYALLGACQKWVHVELGRWIFEHAVDLNKRCAAAYVCMGNLHAVDKSVNGQV